MKKYIFKEKEISNEFKYIFLCGVHFDKKEESDKRKVLRKFLESSHSNYKPIILEDNFVVGKSNSFLSYDDIFLKDLYSVEMLMTYLSDNIFIIHESISTAAETGLFLSEKHALEKTCLLVPDKTAIEEDKIGQFIQFAFLREPNKVQLIYYFPRIEKQMVSDQVQYWHTFFNGDVIGDRLGKDILEFVYATESKHQIRFTKSVEKIKENYIYYNLNKEGKLTIRLRPRALVCCVAAVLNIPELQKKFFDKEDVLNNYVGMLSGILKEVFCNSIEEKSGIAVDDYEIEVETNVRDIKAREVIGMCLYLFQAAGHISIKKTQDFSTNKTVKITRTTKNKFFYLNYEDCIESLPDKQII